MVKMEQIHWLNWYHQQHLPGPLHKRTKNLRSFDIGILKGIYLVSAHYYLSGSISRSEILYLTKDLRNNEREKPKIYEDGDLIRLFQN